MQYNYLFGPVPSRRLGLSLGIDLVPYKVCNLNCIYCESGKTTRQINQREEFVPLAEVMQELRQYLSSSPKIDYITFSGAGEPTLYKGLGELISMIRTSFPQYKTALITNSVLLMDKQIREEILNIDVILPSLDAVSQDVFKKINRPLNNISSQEIANSLVEFRKVYKGYIWLEVFLLPGINDHIKELTLLKEAIVQIRPDKVQLNTLDRPGAQAGLVPVAPQRMLEIMEFFLPLNVEIASRMPLEQKADDPAVNPDDMILNIILRRPCTLPDLEKVTSLDKSVLEIHLKSLIISGKIITEWQSNELFYILKG